MGYKYDIKIGGDIKKTYRTNIFSTGIDIFDVVRETAGTIWVKTDIRKKPEQFRKFSDSYQFFNTLIEAKKYLTDRYLGAIEYHKKQIERANEDLKKVQAIE